jgi:protein involved in polysaccharide export with SLBB domain
LACLAVPALAQTPQQLDFLRQNPELVRQQLLRSGLSVDQMRARLQSVGLSPDLVNRFLEPGADTTGVPLGAEALRALEVLGVARLRAEGLEFVPVDTGLVVSVTPARAATAALELFGLDVFRGLTTRFQPVLSGPVPLSYKVGPGDVMVLVITGDVEFVHELSVTREGFIMIPQVGQIFVSNLTMEQLNGLLRQRLGRSYSGIRTGTTRFDVTIARLRTNQVFVIGEVMQPGAYQLASVATTLNALYAAGGLSERGNFREIQVRRNGQVVSTLDLYDYLLRGDTRSDVRLETGDVVFVGVHGPRVAVAGAVVREGVYEVTDAETLRDVLGAAGRFAADADLTRVTVHRILPSAERGSPGVARSAIDVELVSGAGSGRPDSGDVMVPPLEMRDGDSIVVHALPPVREGLFVGIAGAVRRPGTFPWRRGLTLRELVRLAGGPTVGADLRIGEIARMPRDRQAGQLADTLQVPLDSSYLADRDTAGRYSGPPGVDFPLAESAPEVELLPYDQVLLLTQPEFELQRTVTVTGEVLYPGTYALIRKDEQVTDLLQRAGGLRATAYAEGARFYRRFEYTGLGDTTTRRQAPTDSALVLGPVGNMDQVNLSLAAALRRPGSPADMVLQPGDSLHVPEYLPTVRVSGAVVAPSSVQFVEGRSAHYYIENAGGFAENADEGRTVVRFANGSARTRGRFLFFASWPEPGPGAEVFVPVKTPKPSGNWLPIMATVASILASTASVVVIALTR